MGGEQARYKRKTVISGQNQKGKASETKRTVHKAQSIGDFTKTHSGPTIPPGAYRNTHTDTR